MKCTRFYTKVVLWVTAIFLILTGCVFAASPTLPEEETISLEIGKLLKINSKTLGEERPILVYTPSDYASSGALYPVLYLLDGDYHFHHATGIVDFLSKLDRMPRMIVVGIQNIDRIRCGWR